MNKCFRALLIIGILGGGMLQQHRSVGAAGAPVINYPRLANLYEYGNGNADQATTYSHYAMVVTSPNFGPSGKVALFKAVNPATQMVAYIDSTAVPSIAGFGGETIQPQWWLTFAGTTLAGSISATATSIPVTNAQAINAYLSYDRQVVVDNESMNVVSVNTSTNTLTVTRGYLSTATSHAAGAHIAVHAANWSGVWMINLTQYCPVVNGMTAEQYLVQYARQVVSAAPWDGIYYDNANYVVSGAGTPNFDANRDNVADGAIGWAAGEAQLLADTAAALPGKLIMANGPGAEGPIWNGETAQELEHFPAYLGSWANGLQIYQANSGNIVNADTNDTGTINLQTMRFGLGTALLGNGYYAYDYGPSAHGQTWWFDEYDDGAGSSLSTAMNATQTTVSLASGSGNRFKIGDVVWISNGQASPDDEQMLVTAVNGDTLTVQRGYNGTPADAHPALLAVMTEAQRTAGQGWLGQPLGSAVALGTNQYSRQFTNGMVFVNGDSQAHTYYVGAGYRHILGTQNASLNNGASVSSVTVPASDAVLLAQQVTGGVTTTPSATATSIPAASATPMPSATATSIPAASATNTPPAAATQIPAATATNTPAAASTQIPVATSTQIPVATSTIGVPLIPATQVPGGPTDQIVDGTFESANSAPWQFLVTSPAAASFVQDTSTAGSGTASANVNVTRLNQSGGTWSVQLIQYNLNVTAGRTYVLTFQAKASAVRPFDAVLKLGGSPFTIRSSTSVMLSTGWQSYTVSYTAPATESDALLFAYAYNTGNVWLDNVHFQ